MGSSFTLTPGGGSGGSGKSGSGITGFLGHLTGDVRDAVVGMPMGIEQLFTHPKTTVENMGRTTWHDWSPLFHGDIGKFGHQFYDHPLAPLLDVATVFSGGAALGGKLADVGLLGEDNVIANALKSGATTRTLTDPTDAGRMAQQFETSSRNYKRGIQNNLYKLTGKYADHLPHWFTPAGKYERLHLVNSIDRHTGMLRANNDVLDAYNAGIAAIHKTGQTLTEYAQMSDPLVLNHIYDGMLTNGIHFDDRMMKNGRMVTTKVPKTVAFVNKVKQDFHIGKKTEAARGLSDRHGIQLQGPEDAHSLLKQTRKELDRYKKNPSVFRVHSNVAKDRAALLNQYARHDKVLNENTFQFKKTVMEPKAVYTNLPKGWGYIKADSPELRKTFEHNGTAIEDRLTNLGNNMMTDNPARAMRDASGKALIAQKRDLRDLGYEGKRAAIFSKALYKYPTRIWKMALVGMSPKMVVDNAVGNWMMYAMKQGGHHAVRGVLDAIHQTRGAKAAAESSSALERLVTPHWMDKHFKNELGQSFFGSTIKDTFEEGKQKGGFLREGFYPAVHRFADQPVRRAAISAYFRGHPTIKAAMKTGKTFDQSVVGALKNEGANGKLFRGAVTNSRAIAGDYHTLSDGGRIMKDLIPFYMWDRHIVRHFGNLITEHPGRVALLQQLSHQGALATAAASGTQLPDFLAGIIPMGHTKGGRLEALSTQGLNPYSTVADLADAFTAATTGGQKATAGEALGGDLNPVLTNLFESLSGHRLGTDAPVKGHGGVASSALINMAEGLPQAQLLLRLGNPGGHSNAPVTTNGRTKQPKLYADSLKELLTNMAGFPIKDISPQDAALLQQKENKTKKHKGFSLAP